MADRKRNYDSTVARIAGNILSGYRPDPNMVPVVEGDELPPVLLSDDLDAVEWAVAMAREIVAETQRTEPVADPAPGETHG